MNNSIYFNIIKNDATLENLFKLIVKEYKATAILVSWVVENKWYLSKQYEDGLIKDYNLYLDHEPKDIHYNIPEKNYVIIKIDHCKLIAQSTIKEVRFEDDSDKRPFIELFLDKIYLQDKIIREKRKHKSILNNIVHCIRTPLNTSNDIAQIFMSLTHSIIDITDAVLIDENELYLDYSNFEVRKLETQIHDNFSKFFPDKDLIIYLNVIETMIVKMDFVRVKQIVLNFLSYIAVHSNTEIFVTINEIVINGTNLEKYLEFEIDSDFVFNKDFVASLYEPFDLSSKQPIGLKIAARLIDMMGGSIKIDSNIILLKIMHEKSPPNLRKFKDLNILVIGSSIECTLPVTYITTIEEYAMYYSDKTFHIIIFNLNTISQRDLIGFMMIKDKCKARTINVSNIKKYDVFDANCNYDELEPTLARELNIYLNSSKSILIVEDEYPNRVVLQNRLKKLGYTNFKAVASGEEALDYLKISKYDIALIDIRMPGMSGFELADAIHNLYQDIKMIGVTAQIVLESDKKEYFNTFLIKPFTTEQLEICLSNI